MLPGDEHVRLSSARSIIQEDLNKLNEYCKINKLLLAYNKCKHITFTKKKKHNIILNCYNLNNCELENVTTIRDLGLILDTKLTLDSHADHILRKAYQILGFIMRVAKPFKQKHSLMSLYNCLVRSNLEYASIAWNPYYNIYINKIEMVQKKFVRYVIRKLHLPRRSYIRALPEFKLLSLQDRRSIADVVMLRNICTGDVTCPQLLSGIRFRRLKVKTFSAFPKQRPMPVNAHQFIECVTATIWFSMMWTYSLATVHSLKPQ